MLKILSSESKSITGAAIIIATANLASRAAGVIRDRIFAHFYGAGPTMDAYYAAFKIPDLIYNLLIVGALTAGFIPTFSKIFFKGADKRPAWRLADNVITILGLAIATIGLLGAIFTPYLARFIAPGFSGEHLRLTIIFTRIMFLSPFFLGISMVMGGILQSLRQFVIYSIAPIFYNLGIIIGASLLVKTGLGISGLAWGVSLGAFFHAATQIFAAYRAGYRWHWRFDLFDAATREIGRLMIPRAAGLAVSQVNLVIVTILASLLPAGSVAVYNYANNLQGLPIGVIGISFAIAVLPALSRAAGEEDFESLFAAVSATIRKVLFLIIPVSVLFMLLRAQIVRVVLGTGAFNWGDTIKTADALALFSLGIFAHALVAVLVRAFYALGNTKTPFLIGVASELVTIFAGLWLMRPLGAAGLALAASLGGIVNCLALYSFLRRRIPAVDEDKLLAAVYKIISAALVMALLVQLLKYPLAKIFNQIYFWGIFGQGLVAGLIGLVIYGIICRLLKLDELIELQSALKRRWLVFRNVPAGIDEAEGL